MSRLQGDEAKRWLVSRSLLFILLLAVLLRMFVAIYLGDTVPTGKDEHSYSLLAGRLAQGYGFTFADSWYPFTPAATPTSHWSFLYTAYVAVIYAVVGPHPLAVRLISGILGGLLIPWLTYRLAGRLFPGRPALHLLSAALSAIYAFFVLYAAMLMTETFYIAALLWSLERALALPGQGKTRSAWSWSTAATLGVSLGIAALLRQSVLPWVAILFGWLLVTAWAAPANSAPWRARRCSVALLALAGFVMLLFILPFTLRNYRVYGDVLLLNSNAGYAMYSAQHPLHGTDFQAFAAAPLPDELLDLDLNEAQWDRELMRRGIGFVVADPVRYLRLSASRLLDYFEFWPTATTPLHNLGRLLSFTLFLPFYVAGIWLTACEAWRESGNWRLFLMHPLALLLLFIFSYSLIHIFTWAMPRYRLPVDAVAMPLAAVALLKGWRFLAPRLLPEMGGNEASSINLS